ncbi:hypothetical protein FN846DRAFT_973635 [Sphaerosporella brunnea]|uniref:C2H2-type domain-containing protein n=1 Tax=Sphaerosporella brunnea TaxID=1250544 RepID=A0A5J5EI00_9PEZI|nr:hypothetical protein FN846DRAFT_973635 [Sphaerosporella brunnea]
METTHITEIENGCGDERIGVVEETSAAGSADEKSALSTSTEEKQPEGEDLENKQADAAHPTQPEMNKTRCAVPTNATDEIPEPLRIDKIDRPDPEEAHKTSILGSDADAAHQPPEESTAVRSAEEIRQLKARIEALSQEKDQLSREKDELREKNHDLSRRQQNSVQTISVLHKVTLEQSKGDVWLDNWDPCIFRCTKCNRPLATRERLDLHQARWHSPGLERLEIGKYASPQREAGPELEKLVKDGDLILQTPLRSFLVSSQVLCMTSKVFQKMCGRASPFKEAADVRRANVLGCSPAVICLEDDLEALKFILMVLHHRHDMLPPNLGFDALVEVAGICDKYEFHSSLKLVVDNYLEPHKSILTSDSDGYENWLFLSYVFGHAEAFTQVSKKLILAMSFPGDHLQCYSRPCVSCALSNYTPSAIIDKILEKRQTAVDKIRNHVESIQTQWSHSSGEKATRHCTRARDQDACDALLLGHLINSVAKHRLNEDQTWKQSLQSIANGIKQIPNLCFPGESVSTIGPGIFTRPGSGSSIDFKHPYRTTTHLNCTWVTALQRTTVECINSIEGLQLSDFASSQRNV